MLKKLAKIESASWAIWSDNFGYPDCIEQNTNNIYEFIVDNKNKLKRNIIFLGLNRSGVKLKNKDKSNAPIAPFHNFHLPNKKGDRNLYKFIQKNKMNALLGAYMTDLNTKKVDPKSGNVKINNGDRDVLLNQLNILGTTSCKVICFMPKTFNCLLGLLKHKQHNPTAIAHKIKYASVVYNEYNIEVFGVWHYSNWGKYKYKLEELENQLRYINDLFSEEGAKKTNMVQTPVLPS